jgi:hypothetical protein
MMQMGVRHGVKTFAVDRFRSRGCNFGDALFACLTVGYDFFGGKINNSHIYSDRVKLKFQRVWMLG